MHQQLLKVKLLIIDKINGVVRNKVIILLQTAIKFVYLNFCGWQLSQYPLWKKSLRRRHDKMAKDCASSNEMLTFFQRFLISKGIKIA